MNAGQKMYLQFSNNSSITIFPGLIKDRPISSTSIGSFLFQPKITINTSKPQQLPMSVNLGKTVSRECGARFRKISRL